MKKYITILIMMFVGFVNAQTFDFTCVTIDDHNRSIESLTITLLEEGVDYSLLDDNMQPTEFLFGFPNTVVNVTRMPAVGDISHYWLFNIIQVTRQDDGKWVLINTETDDTSVYNDIESLYYALFDYFNN